MRGTIQFLTETGSRYEVNYDSKTWKRLSKTSESGCIRGESGNLLHYPAIIVGQPCTLMDGNVLPDHDAHAVCTSRVLKAELMNSKTLKEKL